MSEILDLGDDSLGESFATETRSLNSLADEISEMTADEDDWRDAFMVVKAGSGGKEAQDWASILLRMYCKWVSRCGFSAELMDIVPTKTGIRFAMLRIKGKGAYGRLKTEQGVHRLSRVSPYDQADRRQTSFSSVEVEPDFPEAKTEIVINPKELDVYYCCGSGPGGQAINKTEVVAVVKHLPTGIIVRSQATRSQQQNKEVAIGILRSKLLHAKNEEKRKLEEERQGKAPKAKFGGGRERSYVLSQHPMVCDHRTGKKVFNVAAVMEGDLSELVD